MPYLLRRNGKRSSVLLRVHDIRTQQVPEEASDSRAPTIARRRGVRAILLQVNEELANYLGVHVVKGNSRKTAALVRGDEFKEQLQRVAIGMHSMLARASHALQVVGKERLDAREQRGRRYGLHSAAPALCR